jgi:hypothetical protein
MSRRVSNRSLVAVVVSCAFIGVTLSGRAQVHGRFS